MTNRRPPRSERAGLPEAGRAKEPFINEVSCVKVRWGYPISDIRKGRCMGDKGGEGV